MLNTGFGYWEPIIFALTFLLLGCIAYFIYIRGNPKHKKVGEQLKPFLSGNPEPAKELVHIRGRHIYWGFKEAFAPVYRKLDEMHDGDVRNYMLWFFGILVILMLIFLGGM